MSAIVIGSELRHVTFAPEGKNWSDGNGTLLCRAAGSFAVDSLHGKCSTVLSDLSLNTFIADVETMHRDLRGVATLWGGNAADPNARVELAAEKGGRIVVRGSFSDWSDQEDVGFKSDFQFALDQSFLPSLILSAKIALRVFA